MMNLAAFFFAKYLARIFGTRSSGLDLALTFSKHKPATMRCSGLKFFQMIYCQFA
jgi:hypothetical protein